MNRSFRTLFTPVLAAMFVVCGVASLHAQNNVAGEAETEEILPVELETLSTYINGLKSAQADFRQFNDDGSEAWGVFYIRRPGRMRFEYEGRDAPVVVAGSGTLAVFDSKSNAGAQRYPLRRTPLQLILKRKVDLAEADLIQRHDVIHGLTRITAQDPERPEAGQVELLFTPDPVALSQWVVTDESGTRTIVQLGPLETDVKLDAALFDIDAMIEAKQPTR